MMPMTHRAARLAKAKDTAAAQRRRYADAGPEMVRLLKMARKRLLFGAEVEELDAVLKAVQPKKEKR